MKKIFAIIVVLCTISVNSFAVETSRCLLQHNGNVTMYDGSKIADALTAAVSGDTLYLSKGSFPGFTLNKEITVRGAGQETAVAGDVAISISGTPTLKQTLLEGLCISGNTVTLSSTMNAVKIKQCMIQYFSVSANNDNIVLDRCHINGDLYQSSYIKGLTATNSKINEIYTGSDIHPTDNVCNFVNCNIINLYNNNSNGVNYSVHGTFINCIIKKLVWYGYYSDYNYLRNCIFTNTLHGWDWTLASSTEQNCYLDTDFTMSLSECSYDTSTLESKNYLGNDGKVVGIYGGTTPFTLVLDIPKVSDETISLDNDTKTLKVSLKVSAK